MELRKEEFSQKRQESDIKTWLYAVLLLHFVVWVIVPLLTKPNFPLDVVECYLYGQEWALASTKHPPLPAWMTILFSYITGNSSAAPYIAAQVFVFFAFFANWKLASAMLPPPKAFLAVSLMEFYTYFTFYSLEFNNSISLIGCWSLATLSFYYAIEHGKLRYWLLCGLFLGMGVMGKYSGFILVAILLAFMFYEPKARKYWKTTGPYLTTLIAFLLFFPHFLAVIASDFSTFGYISDRVDDATPNLMEHLIFPIRFFLTQLGVIAPILCGFLLFSNGKFHRRHLEEKDRFNARFLVFLVLVPFVFQLAVSFFFRVKLSTIYGSHIWIFLGLFLVFFLKTDEKKLTPRRIFSLFLVAMFVMVVVTCTRDIASPYLRKKPSRIHYPGREIARIVDETWHKHYESDCPNLTGEWWLAGMAAAYGTDRQEVFCYIDPDYYYENEKVLSLWTNLEDVRREGGICLWDVNHYPEKVPPLLFEEYPDAKILPTVILRYSTGADLPPLQMGMAIIPPKPDTGKSEPD